VQVSEGFGDTARGIFARRPHWAPDGSAIVFESNVYDVPARDNLTARGYHLYYVGYDPIANKVAVRGANGQLATKLVYGALLATGTVLDHRLTKADGNQQHARWLRGKFEESGHSYLGELLLETSDASFGDSKVARLRIETPINAVDVQEVSLFSELERGATVGLLAAHRRVRAGQPALERMFLEKEWVSYGEAPDYSVRLESSADGPVAVVTYTPRTPAALCHDLNRNRACDTASEDRNGDGQCTADDCMAAEVHDLFVAYDLSVVEPKLDAEGAIVAQPGALLAAAKKQLRTADVHPNVGGDFIAIDVASPINALAIAPGSELARIALHPKSSATISLALRERKVRQALYVKTNKQEPAPFVIPEGQLGHVREAVFSPDGSRLALAAVESGRPVLVSTEDLSGTQGLDKASIVPMRVEGLDWERVQRLYPCNWVGGYRNPFSGFYVSAFRGGIDELKVYSYARSAGAFASDAARGHDLLAADGRDAPIAVASGTCTSDLECPPYQLCTDGACATKSCDPRDPYSCARGACSLEPVPASLDTSEARWVCSVDCNADAECFQQECLNGPCRFCSDKLACTECRETVQDVGGLKIAAIEGCPDRNSFACEQGSCVTECYEIEDGHSTYLCDPATQYCKRGRCAAFDWSWQDLAPATLAGSGETQFNLPNLPVTTAISQLYPVEIEAYGVEDYGHPPELAVEGKIDTQGAQVYGTGWFDLGRVLVYNRTKGEAGSRKYTVYSPYPVTQLRLRLLTPPYENMNAGATGLLARDAQFCNAKAWSQGDRSACYRRASGSRPTVGYAVSIPEWEARRAWEQRTGAEHGYDSRQDDLAQSYLYGGQPAVIIRGLKVNGTSVLGGAVQRNLICAYADANQQGSLVPFDGERPRKLLFGDVAREQSNQKNAYFSSAPASTLLDVRSVTGASWAVLNCPFANPEHGAEVADLVVKVDVQYPNPGVLAKSFGITESKNGCLVELAGPGGTATYEPCREWVGGTASFDPMNDERQLHHTVDYYEFTSFGYDE
jgi:hypothetical protein